MNLRTGDNPYPAVLFTAFEPSGDDHASAVIAELKRRHPELPIYAWGGPKMLAAGATIVERTGDDAVMGLPGFEKIREHHRINGRIPAWLSRTPVALHVPVDSPAANFPICAIAKKRGIRVVHLVAPQIWAWARWRIHKLRRRTDLVLCLLPFEERFFQRRNVPAKFIGHFLFDEAPDTAALDRDAAALPDGAPRLAIMPGSRPDELRRNFPLMLDVFRSVRARHPNAVAVVAATRTPVEAQLRAIADSGAGWPEGMAITVGKTDAIIRWCDLALVKSGTVTLQVTRQLKPMVIVYKKHNPLLFALARAVLSTKRFTLPNVIAGADIVPEFVPHYGSSEPVARAVLELIESSAAAAAQRRNLADLVAQFNGTSARRTAADEIERFLGIPRAPRSSSASLAGAAR